MPDAILRSVVAVLCVKVFFFVLLLSCVWSPAGGAECCQNVMDATVSCYYSHIRTIATSSLGHPTFSMFNTRGNVGWPGEEANKLCSVAWF